MEGLRIFFRKHQLLSKFTSEPVTVVCGDIASYESGTVDSNWYEMTDHSEGLEKLQLTFSKNNGETNQSASNSEKAISLSLTFSDEAFTFIWNWLLSTPCQMLNSIDVRIDDTLCGKSYSLFEIKCDNIDYRPIDGCILSVQLREQDLTWHCVHKTFIWDDWNGFMSTKNHPTFYVCVEPRPRLVASARMGLAMFYWSNPAVDVITNGVTDNVKEILNADNFCPAPLIRDYIDNVAGKCGMTVDTIFHRIGTPEYSACLFHPLSGSMYQKAGGGSPSMKMIDDNRWNVTLAEFLDYLKEIYCCEWFITGDNKLIFKPTQELAQDMPIGDFTTGDFLVRDLSYTFSGKKKAAYGRYQYSPDGSDMGAQEIAPLYNDVTDYDGASDNPMLEGEKTKVFQFSPTSFVRDGKSKDYMSLLIKDGFIITSVILALILTEIVATASLTSILIITPFVVWWEANMLGDKKRLERNLVKNPLISGSVRMVISQQTIQPRIIIWDNVDMAFAKAVKFAGLPAPAPYYNPSLKIYTTLNDISKDNPTNAVYNYPTYFDSNFEDNLFDRFHDKTDNPLKSKETNQDFSFNTDLCCGVIDLLGLWFNGTPKIGYLIKIEERDNYDIYGKISDLQIDYDNYTVTVKGNVIKKNKTT